MECNDGVVANKRYRCKEFSVKKSAYKKMNRTFKKYKHSPAHYFEAGQYYMITAVNYDKASALKNDLSKEYLKELMLNKFSSEGWGIIAYAILNNHYHIIVRSNDQAENLPQIINYIHRFSALEINKIDGKKGRKVWWNYWDTVLTYESSYYARLNYVHFNPRKHKLCEDTYEYEYCSYKNFYDSDPQRANNIETKYPFDKVNVRDDF